MSTADPQASKGLSLANFPAWAMLLLAFGSVVVAVATASAISSRDVSDLRVRQDADEVWKTATERRLAEVDKAAAVSTAKIEKDLETLKTGVSDLRTALMGGRTSLSAPKP